MQRECKFCDDHQQVNMDKPSDSDKWIVTNLDGSAHKHNKSGGTSSSAYGSEYGARQAHLETKQEYQATRDKAWKDAHQENMDSSERLRRSIDNLTEKLDKIVDAFLRDRD